jgi:CHAT domain-containing protein
MACHFKKPIAILIKMKTLNKYTTFKHLFIKSLCVFCVFEIEAQSLSEAQNKNIFINDSLMKNRHFAQATQHILQNQAEATLHIRENPIYYFQITNQRGHLLYYLEKYDSSILILNDLAAMISQTVYKDSTIYGDIFNTTGINHRKLRQYESAERAYLVALRNLEPFKNSNKNCYKNYGTRLQNLAILYVDMGRTDEGIEFSKKTLTYTEQGSDVYFARLNTLALAYKRKGRFKEALQMMQMIVNQTNTKDVNYPIRLIGLASMYADIQLWDKAEALQQQAKDIIGSIYGKNSFYYANVNNNLSVMHRQMGHDSLALSYSLEACRVAESQANQINYHQYLCQLADCYFRVGETHKALDLAEKSVQYLESHGAKQAEPYFWATETLIRIYQKMNLLDKAIALNEATLANFKAAWSESDDKCLNSTMRLIQLYQNNQQFDKSTLLLKTLAHTMNTQIIYNLDVLDEESKMIFINKSVKEYHHLLLSQLQNAQKNDSELIRAAYQAELAMKGVVLGSTQIFRQMVRSSKDPAIQKGDRTRILLNQAIEKAYSQQLNPNYIDSLKNVLNLLETKLMTAMPELNAVQRQNIDFERISASLPSNSCAIEFTHFRYYDTKSWTDTVFYGAMLIKPNQAQPEWIYMGSEKQLYDLLKYKTQELYAARGKKRSRKRGATFQNDLIEPSIALYHQIWKPLEAHLSGVKTIYYAPSGLLHRVSFAALQVNATDLLSDKYDLQAVSSTKNVLLETATQDKSLIFNDKNTFLIYGGIQYDADRLALANAASAPNQTIAAVKSPAAAQRNNSNTAWTYLAGTKLELERISNLFKAKKMAIKTRTDFAASEDDFKKQQYEPISPSVIHFATHGFFYQNATKSAAQSFQSASNPLIRSGLVMAGANRVWMGEKPYLNFEDGILTAYEISLMNLSNTKLVVLSACETGLGEIQGSEGVYGLQRAFKMAGVEMILMSLWQVPDKQTAELMEKFYTYLLDNQSIQAAFAHAQQAMKAKYPPYYWAGFVLIK